MERAVSTVLGVLLLTALAVALAGAAGVIVLDRVEVAGVGESTLPVELEASVDVGENSTRVVLLHESGQTLNVEEIELRILVNGVPLRHQPTVPFYSAPGFGSFPSGPFNPSADPRWELGERAILELTGENRRQVGPGANVRIGLYRDDLPIARVETTAH